LLWGCPIHPNRLVRRCNLPGTPVFDPSKLLRRCNLPGAPEKASALTTLYAPQDMGGIMLERH